MRFLIAINRIIGIEGGYVNNPNDPGGETNWGISKRAYPNVDIKNLTREGAIDIYERDFWEHINADLLPNTLDYQLLDSAVNSGIHETIRFLQEALGVADDGVWGPHSAGAASQLLIDKAFEARVTFKFLSNRLDFMTRCANWADAGKGWARRIALNLNYAAGDL